MRNDQVQEEEKRQLGKNEKLQKIEQPFDFDDNAQLNKAEGERLIRFISVETVKTEYDLINVESLTDLNETIITVGEPISKVQSNETV